MSEKIKTMYSSVECFNVFCINPKQWEVMKKKIDKEFKTYEEVRIYFDENFKKSISMEGHVMRDDAK